MPELERIKNGFFNRYPDRITTIDSHTQGEPTRLLVGGVGDLPGDTIKAKRDHFESHFDHLRQLLTREPRGHRGIMAAVVTEPVSPRGAFGLFYMDARRYPYLCGHATIGAVASLVDAGALADRSMATRPSRSTPRPGPWMPIPASATARWNPWPLTWCPHLFLIRGGNSRSPVSARSPSTWSAWAVFSPWCRPGPWASN
jgi:hypothetical protein